MIMKTSMMPGTRGRMIEEKYSRKNETILVGVYFMERFNCALFP